MARKIATRLAVALPVLAFGFGLGAAQAQAPTLKALAGLESGRWQLREAGGASETICLPDATALIQVQHADAQCSRFVIEDDPRDAVVHYTCPGKGHGRTTLKVETPRSVHIETQGVADGAPFQHQYQARKIGQCSPAAR
ncbi:DUF3617 domain-containing protein [Stakelama marina]|uniref:DUF3617 family protein n=1 Tax=Stakelama marina TaxID=2826939 RepID=A0A8T4INF3_9SPHN|nr:hypothetical protein [Stakelama marina]MBR0553696.1 hypothetical protein [Stakelama marina]